ncbi:hypothetical protein [Streptomyces sp. NPDC055607]
MLGADVRDPGRLLDTTYEGTALRDHLDLAHRNVLRDEEPASLRPLVASDVALGPIPSGSTVSDALHNPIDLAQQVER